MPNSNASEFFLAVFLIIAVLALAGWIMKKNPFAGIIVGCALGYAVYDFLGIQLFDILEFMSG